MEDVLQLQGQGFDPGLLVELLLGLICGLISMSVCVCLCKRVLSICVHTCVCENVVYQDTNRNSTVTEEE